MLQSLLHFNFEISQHCVIYYILKIKIYIIISNMTSIIEYHSIEEYSNYYYFFFVQTEDKNV